MPRILVVDNYDSFTYNLVQMFMAYPLDIRVLRSDAVTPAAVREWSPDYLLVSPGPKDPAHSGQSIPLILDCHERIPVLGVCLGLQCMNEAFGGRTVRAPVPVHGKTSRVHHNGDGLFAGLPSPFSAARYHSLMAADVPPVLTTTAWSDDGVVMGLAHRDRPLFGVQFHPESFMTEQGVVLVNNFLRTGPLGRQTP